MGLLKGRTSVSVIPSEWARDKYGTLKRVEKPAVAVPATVQWLTVEEAAEFVVSPNTAVRVIAPSWPGKEQDRFTWNGKTFEQIGPAQKFYGSRRTAHFEVMARLTSEAVSDG